MAQFLNDHNVKNLESEKPVLKVKRNPCIDLLLTNSLSSFQGTMTVTAGLSDCHKIVAIVLKKSFQRLEK